MLAWVDRRHTHDAVPIICTEREATVITGAGQECNKYDGDEARCAKALD